MRSPGLSVDRTLDPVWQESPHLRSQRSSGNLTWCATSRQREPRPYCVSTYISDRWHSCANNSMENTVNTIGFAPSSQSRPRQTYSINSSTPYRTACVLIASRSEERRVGKEGVRKCRSRGRLEQ